MNDLVIAYNNQAVVSSRVVAEKFEKEHSHVMRSIREITRAEISALGMYEEHKYKVPNNFKSYPEYYMNRDGFMLLVMGFTTKPAMQVKIAFIKAFNEMEAKLKERNGYYIPKDKVQEYDRHIQELMNENDKLKTSLRKHLRYSLLGWSVEKLVTNEKALPITASFIEGLTE